MCSSKPGIALSVYNLISVAEGIKPLLMCTCCLRYHQFDVSVAVKEGCSQWGSKGGPWDLRDPGGTFWGTTSF